MIAIVKYSFTKKTTTIPPILVVIPIAIPYASEKATPGYVAAVVNKLAKDNKV